MALLARQDEEGLRYAGSKRRSCRCLSRLAPGAPEIDHCLFQAGTTGTLIFGGGNTGAAPECGLTESAFGYAVLPPETIVI